MTECSPTLQQADGESRKEQGGMEANKMQALRVLSEVTATLASEYDLEALFNRFLEMMVRLSGASAGVVRVMTSDGHHLRLAASLGLPPELVEKERLVDINCGICGAALRNDEIRQTRDLKRD